MIKKRIAFTLFVLILGLIIGLFTGLVFDLYNGVNNNKAAYQREAKKLYVECDNGKKGEMCYATLFKKLAKETSLNFSISVLSELELIDPATRGCHLLAHSITIGATTQNPGAWRDILRSVSSNECSGGFIHGVIEAKTRIDPKFVLDEKTAPELCKIEKAKEGKGAEMNCTHIVGHILLAEKNGDIKEAINTCNKFPLDQQYECASGVFMENETRENLSIHGIKENIPWDILHTQEQENICRQYSGVAAKACWREISHMYAILYHDDPKSVFSACLISQIYDYSTECYLHAVGIMVNSPTFDQKSYSFLCSSYDNSDDDFLACSKIVVNSLLINSIYFIDRAMIYCTSLTGQRQSKCIKVVENRLKISTNVEETKKICDKYKQYFLQFCKN